MNIGLSYKDLSHSKKAIVHNKYSNSSPILFFMMIFYLWQLR